MADSKSYSLLDIDRQLKIPLMKISWLDESSTSGEFGQAQSLAPEAGGGLLRSASSAQNRPSSSAQAHSRSTSLGGAILGNMRRRDLNKEDGDETFPSPPVASTSPQPQGDAVVNPPPLDKPLPSTPSRTGTPQNTDALSKPGPVYLKPHITSPNPEEFLVVTGTSPLEPGIGMFMNLDGDPPTRPTLEFERYPIDVVVDAPLSNMSSSRTSPAEEEAGYAIASMAKEFDDGVHHGLEIQDLYPGSDEKPTKHWLEAADGDTSAVYGIRSLAGKDETHFEEIVERLCQRKFTPFSASTDGSTVSLKSSDSRTALSMERQSKEKELFEQAFDSQDDDSLPDSWEATRIMEGEELPRRLAKTEVRLAVWSGDQIWWAIRNPLIVQLDTLLEAAYLQGPAHPGKIDRQAIFTTLATIRGRDARTELEFMTFDYMRQKAGFLLLTSLLSSTEDEQFSNGEINILEEVLVDSKLDARVVLSLIPGVRNETIEGRRGIWIYGGVKRAAETYIRSPEFMVRANNTIGSLGSRTMHFLRRFLASWRKMKGFGSVPDENEVSRTVDAALLLVLLELDQHAPKGLNKGGAVRVELNDLVDRGIECFDRAVDLLESYHRLFVLSRLYQSRKMSGDVLATWRRIIEGEEDAGQELRDGEQRVREYLAKISSQSLVHEYGVWLANRNPKLGVQVFAEDKGRAPKFEPTQVVQILRDEAPNAVRYYLEHLVFGKGHTAYVNELITYYLDVVVGDLQDSADSRERVMTTYDTYRALSDPKPTYNHFLTDNAPPDDEAWHSRLRLLQLLGGDHAFDAAAIRDRIASLPADLLVPETIILAGREHLHEDALRLLVHKLGDYDTAISYCLRGGSSIYTSHAGRRDSMPSAEQQRRLFHVVLREFLAIVDVSDRIEQTGVLLERFGGWFEVDDVLGLIPDGWSVDIVAGFLVGALRRLVKERRESAFTRALSGAENLRVSYDLVVKVEEKGPSIEAPN